MEHNTVVFADSAYWIALIHEGDALHEQAVSLETRLHEIRVRIITSEFVLSEVLSNSWVRERGWMRERAIKLISQLEENPNVEIVPCTHGLFRKGIDHYSKRGDKEYSLVDSISMQIMTELKITEVLSADRHFAQENFTRLLKHD